MQNLPRCSKSLASRGWLRWLLPLAGLLALIWFVLRVVPKPSRATYPCQRVAAPLAGGFVGWLVGLVAAALALRRAGELLRQSRVALACASVAIALVAGLWAISNAPEKPAVAADPTPNEPIGQAKGIHPGRVVWVYDPDATDWAGPTDGYYWQSGHADQAVVDSMMSRAIQALAGVDSDAAAWDAIFRHFNQTHGKGDVGYQPGEKITIKVNLVASIYHPGGDNCVDEQTYEQFCRQENLNTSAEVMLALLRQLVYVAGVAEADIAIGDTLTYFVKHLWDVCHTEFPDVRYLDCKGLLGRTPVQSSNVALYWSNRPTTTYTDHLPVSYVEADYFINLANLKGHEGGGVTLCGKNYYGSLIRHPYTAGYYELHADLPHSSPGMGRYRTLVDLMGHAHTGGKALLYMIDGLWGTRDAVAVPLRWNMPPFNGDWPSSLFVSQDPVAIDSVAFDFLRAEWPDDFPGTVDGADDYLHEAALADDPPSGTFYDPEGDGVRMQSLGVHEHWNNPVDKQYSRNLGIGDGIELIAITPPPVLSGDLDGDGDVDLDDWQQLAAAMSGPLAAIPVLAFAETDGMVVFEAENYHDLAPASGFDDAWVLQPGGGAYGSDRMASLPDDGDWFEPPYVASNAPRMSYYVAFETAGTYYLWVLGQGAAADGDSVHYGLDNVVVSSGYADAPKLQIGSPAWTDRGGSVRTTLQVATAGVHMVDIWGREDGATIDRLLLTTDANYVPTGDGPAESNQVAAEARPVPRQPVQGDLDADGDCDLADLAIFAANFTGPG